jgi:SAM-dependent methyltransferase
MTGTDRRTAEQQFHDRQAAGRAASFRSGRADLVFPDAHFLDHETWVRPAFRKLGDLRGKRALDYGCGHGMAAVTLARAGANVTAFDLSPGYVAEARERATAAGVTVECMVAAGEELPFEDGTFDAVWGNAVLHHLDMRRAGRELARVMKPGGIAVFCEPWGGNPLLGFARRYLPYPGKHRTPDEEPLRHRDLDPLREVFPVVEVEGYQLLGMIRRVWRQPTICWWLDAADGRLLRAISGLHNWCRYAVVTLSRQPLPSPAALLPA